MFSNLARFVWPTGRSKRDVTM